MAGRIPVDVNLKIRVKTMRVLRMEIRKIKLLEDITMNAEQPINQNAQSNLSPRRSIMTTTFKDKSLAQKTFSTEPKTRRHTSPWSISGNRARDFMETLYRKGLKNCSYETLKFEFIQLFETNDPRTIERYIGRLASLKRYSGSNVVRLNRQSGKVARFDYMNERRVEAKKGLIEILGYATREDGRFILHHERLGYSTKQASLETRNSPIETDRNEVSIDDLCARHIGDIEAITPKGKEREKTVSGGCLANVEVKKTREEEESYIEHTHKSVLPTGITEKHTVLQLNPLEKAILRVKPSQEPDRAKVSWPKQEPIIPEFEPEGQRSCGQCELHKKPSCVFPGINFDKVPEDSNFALDCRSFTLKKETS